MSLYLIVQATYADIELGLAQDGMLLEQKTVSKLEASGNILIAIDELLKKQNKSLSNLTFIAASCGPGPFTTLRVALVTLNGLGFATNIPLVGINGLHAFLEEYGDSQNTRIALLDAFTKDVYFGIDNRGTITIGCENIESFLRRLKNEYQEVITFIGSGCLMYQDQIRNILGSQALVAQPLPSQVSLEYLSKKAFENWNGKVEITHQLQPLYLKNMINNIAIKSAS